MRNFGVRCRQWVTILSRNLKIPRFRDDGDLRDPGYLRNDTTTRLQWTCVFRERFRGDETRKGTGEGKDLPPGYSKGDVSEDDTPRREECLGKG